MNEKYEEDFNISVCEGDFEQAMGRPPKDQEEFDEFAHLCKKGLEAQIDWDIIYRSAKENMK